MESTSPTDPDALLDQATGSDPVLARRASRELFAGVVEPLADRFEPALCPVYAEMFAPAIERVIPELQAEALIERYRRIRRARPCRGDAERVFVLSRVTLGADVAVTSVVLDAAKRRFPRAEIVFAGTRKCWELFEADPRLAWLPVEYGRDATLAERLSVWPALREAFSRPGSIVIDPDSRLTQLGLLPVCPDERYYFFESRSYGGNGGESLVELTGRWVSEIFGVAGARAYIAPREAPAAAPITVSLGVGENPAKRVPDPFEEDLVRGLAGLGATLLIDRGAGGEERTRVDRAIAGSGAAPGRIETWDGAFAPFAARIARSRLYVGYDSAGQHVAAACGVPLVSVFAGAVSERMFARWRPTGPGPAAVVRVEGRTPHALVAETLSAAGRLLATPIRRPSP